MVEQIINIERMEHALTLFGSQDENMRQIEQTYGVTVLFRGTDMKVSGEAEAVMNAVRCIEGLLSMVERGESLTSQNIRYVASLVEEGKEQEVQSLNRDVICITAKGKPLKARTLGQQGYVEAIRQNTVTFGIGPAGTGKTYIAIALAVAALKNRACKRIILSRPAVEAGEKLGFLPGDMKDKIDPYLRPLYDALEDMIPAIKLKEYMESDTIQIAPLAFMRGRTLNDAIIILDEAQNTTKHQMKMFLTRLGINAKMIITGDATQIDLPRSTQSGLMQALKILRGVKGIGIIEYQKKDIVRHPLVQRIVDAYEAREEETDREFEEKMKWHNPEIQ